MSVVVVLSSLYPAVTIALARVYLHERLQRLQRVGWRQRWVRPWPSPLDRSPPLRS